MSSPPRSPAAPGSKSRTSPKASQPSQSSSSSISFNAPSSTGTTRRNPTTSHRTADDKPSSARNPPWPASKPTTGAQAENNRVDALWAKMQMTLEDVELSALGSTHVFGKAHNDALEELRAAQIALAKAWGKGEVDDEFAAMDEAWSDGAFGKDGTDKGERDTSGGAEKEVAEAKKRREANDRFFAKVGQGVEEVVSRLDEVAAAMAKVEMESREIWDDKDSFDSSSLAS